ncbi:MAG: dipicolinate synthase subunit B [Oscillospiraceae bacterium]|nr:dipicolinate synthase subunit B [Oscillospiraceae bacterium]
MGKLRLGIAMCGSYCTYDKVLKVIDGLCEKYDVSAIMSENAGSTDSRFGRSEDFRERLKLGTGKNIIDTISLAEPIGPKELLDILLIMPCTGNTVAKLANGITDTAVTMAAKAHLRNERPVVLAVATNDGLSGNAANIGSLLNRRNIYFVPFYQDDPVKKPRSLMADFELASDAIDAAMEGRQLQPIITVK